MSLALVIDDEAGIRNMVRRFLEEAGHEVIEAEGGIAGVRVFQERAPDLALVDLFMPKKEGIQTIREMRELRPDIRIIAMSGGGTFKLDLLDGMEFLGASVTLRKPF